MKVAFVNQDPGIDPAREKGAAVHLRALRAALAGCGAEVVALDEPDDSVLRAALGAEWGRGPFDLVYERYALGRTAACRFAVERDVPFALEVNAPLLEEASRFRGHLPREEEIAAEALLLTHATRVFAVSAPVAAYVRSRGGRRVEVCPNGVDAELFRPRPGSRLRERLAPPGVTTVGFHGRLRPWHGLDLLARAFGLALARGAPLHLLTVGRGDFEAALEPHVPSARRAHFDWMPHEQVAEHVACFDVLALSYREDGPLYFSPLKLAEGMASGAVPVAPRGGDWTRNLRHGENALLYELGDAHELAGALQSLCDPELRARLGAAARETAQRLSWRVVAERVLELVPTREAAR